MSDLEEASHANVDLQATHQIIQFLEEAKAQSELILDSLSGLLLILDSDGTLYRCNQNAADFFGFTFEHEIGFNLGRALGAEKWKLLAEQISNSKKSRKSLVDFEMEIQDKSQAISSFQWSLRPVVARFTKQISKELFILVGHDLSEIKSLTAEKSRMQQELLTAQTVQETLFADPHFQNDQYAVAGYYKPATECGGDWWFYNQIDDKIYLWIGDVTGHGVSSALVTSAARAAVSVIETMPAIKPTEALRILNRAVFAASKGEKLMTFFVVAIDIATGDCAYSNAGHLLPYLVRLQGPPLIDSPTITSLSSPTSYMLGQVLSGEFDEGHFHLDEGDRLFLFTDGVAELENKQHIQLGERKARRAVMKSTIQGESLCQFMDKFCAELEIHRDGAELADDVTFFIFEFKKKTSQEES